MSLPTINDARLPQSYEHARAALANCSSIDECKEWADKAEALASYARMADDESLQKMALRIKARAVRRCGQLLEQYNGQGTRTDKLHTDSGTKLTKTQAAEEANMSKRQKDTAVRVAKIGDDEFNAAVESESPPTVTSLATGPKPEGFAVATQAIGKVREFSKWCQKNDPALVANGVFPHEIIELKALQCAVSSRGEPTAFAGCTAGRLMLKELVQCSGKRFGEGNCFGKNNTFRKFASEVLGIKIGPSSVIADVANVQLDSLTYTVASIQAASETAEDLGKEAEKFTENLVNLHRSIVEDGLDTGNKILQEAKDAPEKILEGVDDVVDDGIGRVKDTVGKAKEKVDETVDKAKDEVEKRTGVKLP